MPCFVQPLSDQLQVVPVGAGVLSKLLSDRLVLPFTITCGGRLCPAALTHPIMVMVSRFPLVMLCKYLEPFSATILPGLWSSWTPVSSIFQMLAGLTCKLLVSMMFLRQ